MAGLGTLLAAGRALRARDTEREIADDPTPLVVRRQGRATDLAVTARIVRAGTRASRSPRSEGGAEANSDVTILAPAGTDLRVGDRAKAPDGSVYRVVFVMPGQDWRTEADAVVEQ